MIKYQPAFFSLLSSCLLSACVTPTALDRQVPTVEYVPKGKVAIAIKDQRLSVLVDGKPPTYIGKAHGAFGIPADWHVKPVLSTEEGDKERTLAEFLEHRLVTGLGKSGWNVVAANQGEDDDAAAVLAGSGADRLLTMVLKKWYFSINLNWVTAFNFDTAVDVSVSSRDTDAVLTKSIMDRDVVDEEAKQSPQNLILEAYRAQLLQILMDADVREALSRSAASTTANYDSQPANYEGQSSYSSSSQLRAVNEVEKSSCDVIKIITTGAGGSSNTSVHAKKAMDKALADAAKAGANSYYVVSVDTTATGASVVLDALSCQ